MIENVPVSRNSTNKMVNIETFLVTDNSSIPYFLLSVESFVLNNNHPNIRMPYIVPSTFRFIQVCSNCSMERKLQNTNSLSFRNLLITVLRTAFVFFFFQLYSLFHKPAIWTLLLVLLSLSTIFSFFLCLFFHSTVLCWKGWFLYLRQIGRVKQAPESFSRTRTY